jgi:hypothetical protein
VTWARSESRNDQIDLHAIERHRGLKVFNSFSSTVGDSVSSVGSKMRIYVLDRQTLAVRQLIPDAIAPKNPSYWDTEPVWLRSNKAPAVR